MTRPHEPIHAIPLGSTGHTPSRTCHCGPAASMVDLATGATVWRHRCPPSSSDSPLRGDALATAMDRHDHEDAGARERREVDRSAGHRPGILDPDPDPVWHAGAALTPEPPPSTTRPRKGLAEVVAKETT